MAGEADELRGYINGQLESARSASLVRVIAQFDVRQHAIPTVKQLNRALAGLALRATRVENDITLEASTEKLGLQTLSSEDLSFLYKSYVKPPKRKKNA